MKADDVPPDVPPAALNPEKDPDEWVTKDEPMTGPQRSYLQTLCREAGEEFDQKLDQSESFEKDRGAAAENWPGQKRHGRQLTTAHSECA